LSGEFTENISLKSDFARFSKVTCKNEIVHTEFIDEKGMKITKKREMRLLSFEPYTMLKTMFKMLITLTNQAVFT